MLFDDYAVKELKEWKDRNNQLVYRCILESIDNSLFCCYSFAVPPCQGGEGQVLPCNAIPHGRVPAWAGCCVAYIGKACVCLA